MTRYRYDKAFIKGLRPLAVGILSLAVAGCPGGGDGGSSGGGSTASVCAAPSIKTAEGNCLTPIASGTGADYSAALNRLSFARFEPTITGSDGTGTYEIYVSDPDGSNALCISCSDMPGGPRANQHKGAQQWHPTLGWMVAVVEMPAHISAHKDVAPGSGLQNDIYAISADGTQWVKLTSYAPITATTLPPPAPFVPWGTPGGALVPRFNKTGTKVIWGEEIGYEPTFYRFGVQRLAIADFVIVGGVPQLQNKTTFSPPGTRIDGSMVHFYEPWSPNGDGTLMAVATDRGTHNAAVVDIYLFNLTTGQFTTKLSPSPEALQWEEQAQFSPDGTRIAFMTTQAPYLASDFFNTFRPDLWIMNPDGSGKARLTRITDNTRAEFLGASKYALPGTWKDNKSFYFEVNTMTGTGQDRTQSQVYLFSFP